jgi:hypothetical protein
MTDHLNRNTLEFRRSSNEPLHEPPDWIRNPLDDVGRALRDSPYLPRYWVLQGDDTIRDSTGPEKAAIDAASLAAGRDAVAARADDLEDVVRALALVLLDEFNLHTGRVNAILDAIDGASNFGQVKSAIAAINDLPTRDIADIKTGIRNKLGT